MTKILGISAFYHDSAAALVINGEIISAAQEERFSRIKHDPKYPYNAIEFVLKSSNLKLSQIDHIVFFEKPFLKFERLLETYLAFAPKGFKSFSMSMPIWLREKLFQKKFLFDKLKSHDQNFNDIEILESESALIMVNSHPSAITVNTNTVTENIPARSTVATLTSADPDLDETFTYSLIRGEGDKDNAAFSISGDQLLIKASPDFEAKESYSIRLQTADSGGLTHEQSHTLSVRDLNEKPSSLSISSDGISENIAAGSTVATLISADPDFDDSYSYSLVNGDGDQDNDVFSISGNQLLIRSSPDYETKDRYNIRLQTKDSGDLIIDQAFTLNILDINENPSTIVLDTSDNALGVGICSVYICMGISAYLQHSIEKERTYG